MKYQNIQPFIALVMVMALLAGCAVGPDFNRPAAPDVAVYTATPLRENTVAAPTLSG